MGALFVIVTPKNWFWSSDFLVLLLVLVARAGPAEFYNCHPVYKFYLYIKGLHKGVVL